MATTQTLAARVLQLEQLTRLLHVRLTQVEQQGAKLAASKNELSSPTFEDSISSKGKVQESGPSNGKLFTLEDRDKKIDEKKKDWTPCVTHSIAETERELNALLKIVSNNNTNFGTSGAKAAGGSGLAKPLNRTSDEFNRPSGDLQTSDFATEFNPKRARIEIGNSFPSSSNDSSSSRGTMGKSSPVILNTHDTTQSSAASAGIISALDKYGAIDKAMDKYFSKSKGKYGKSEYKCYTGGKKGGIFFKKDSEPKGAGIDRPVWKREEKGEKKGKGKCKWKDATEVSPQMAKGGVLAGGASSRDSPKSRFSRPKTQVVLPPPNLANNGVDLLSPDMPEKNNNCNSSNTSSNSGTENGNQNDGDTSNADLLNMIADNIVGRGSLDESVDQMISHLIRPFTHDENIIEENGMMDGFLEESGPFEGTIDAPVGGPPGEKHQEGFIDINEQCGFDVVDNDDLDGLNGHLSDKGVSADHSAGDKLIDSYSTSKNDPSSSKGSTKAAEELEELSSNSDRIVDESTAKPGPTSRFNKLDPSAPVLPPPKK